jgi:serine/threonine-protein kinase
VPFDGETAVTVAVKHLQEEMVPPSTYCKELPHSLEQIIRKCTQKSPDRRYQNMEDLLADLKQSLMDPDGDFVKMVDLDSQARTVIMTREMNGKGKITHKVEPPEEVKKQEESEEEEDEEDDDEEELSPAVERIMTIAGVALAILIVIILLLLVSRMLGLGKGSSSSTKNDTQQSEEVEDQETEDDTSSSVNTVVMPNLLGDTMTEAKVELQSLGLNITLKGSEVSKEYPAGQIIEQSVESGTRVEVGSNVDVVIAGAGSSSSSNENETTNTTQTETSTTTVSEDTKVPNVVNQTEANARAALEAANLKVGTVTEANSDTVAEGNVISQSLSQNTTVAKNTTVNLVISSGPKTVKVTDVIGHEVTRATGELQSDGFNVTVKEVYTDEMRAGLVVSTSPERGSYVAPGTTVTITVSKGEEQVNIPSVDVGMSFETAEEKLRSAGFKGDVKEAFENSNSVGKDYVTRYSPSSTVSPSGTVTIYVSLGAAE